VIDWLWVASLAAALLIGAGLGYYTALKDVEETPTTVRKSSKQELES
jgi:protein-L-isoaspartate O-methyltransferase